MGGGVNTFVIFTLLGAKELKVMTTLKNREREITGEICTCLRNQQLLLSRTNQSIP